MPPIFEIGADAIKPLEATTFNSEKISERSDLQRLLRDKIDVVAPDVLVISEEFSEWSDSRRRIDLLGVDKDGNIVVIELKRTEDGGHMELQAIRYAAMVSALTAERAVEIFQKYMKFRGMEGDAEQLLLEHLEWDELDEDQFAQDVRIVLVSADFSRELTTAVIWLNEKSLDIRCVRIKPYAYEGRTLIDVQQIIPLPEAGEFQVQIQAKREKERRARKQNRDLTRFDVTVDGVSHPHQWKRRAIHLAVKALLTHGHKPSEIEAFFKRNGRGGTMRWVEGTISNEAEYHAAAFLEAKQNNRKFLEARWFTESEDLMHEDGRTCAFVNQWGGRWHEFMQAIKSEFPEIGLDYSPSEGQ